MPGAHNPPKPRTPINHQPARLLSDADKTQHQPQHLNQFSSFFLRRAVRGSARVQTPHGHSPGPVSTSPGSKPASARHRPHKPYPSNLQGVPCAAVHGFSLPTVIRPAQSAPATSQNPQAPGTVITSWSPTRTRTRALPSTNRQKPTPQSTINQPASRRTGCGSARAAASHAEPQPLCPGE